MAGFNRVAAALILSMGFVSLKAQIQTVSPEILERFVSPELAPDALLMDFETRRIEAGRIKETDTPVYVYTFENKWDKTIEIQGLTSNCGCAVPSFDKRRIAPGEKSCIKVTYHPEGHPGKFERRVFVYTNMSAERPAAVLELSVEVEDSGDRAKWFPVEMGNIRLKTAEHRFRSDMKDVVDIAFLNVGKTPVTPSFQTEKLPDYLSVWCETPDVGSGGEGTISIAFDPEKYALSADKTQRIPVVLKNAGASGKRAIIMIMIE